MHDVFFQVCVTSMGVFAVDWLPCLEQVPVPGLSFQLVPSRHGEVLSLLGASCVCADLGQQAASKARDCHLQYCHTNLPFHLYIHRRSDLPLAIRDQTWNFTGRKSLAQGDNLKAFCFLHGGRLISQKESANCSCYQAGPELSLKLF